MVFDQPARRRSPVPLIIAVVIGLVAVLGVYLFLKPSDSTTDANKPPVKRDGCVPLTVAASSEKAALLTQMSQAYAAADRRFDGKCADVTIVSKASGGALDALATGWEPTRDGGAVPQVWTPAASSWVSLLRQRTTAADRPDLVPAGPLPSIAQSPLVLAMPKPMAEALGWPAKQVGWSDVLSLTKDPQGWASKGHPDWGRFKLGKTNPHFSTSGLNATIGAYFAATGRANDLTLADVGKSSVVSFVKGVEQGVVHYGDTTLTFLSNLAEADAAGRGMSYVSAVAVEEKSVYDYNQGNPTGDPALSGKGRKPTVPLVAVYPREGTLLSDNPYVVLTTASDEQKAAAADFLAFLREAPQQDTFKNFAFRGHDGSVGAAISTGNGLLPDAKFAVVNPPASPVVAKVLEGWDAQRKRARVLLVLDTSGSMEELAAGGATKLELAKKAALDAIGMFAKDDQVGLWAFSTPLRGQQQPYRELVPMGNVGANEAALRSAIQGLAPEGGTALYASTRAAQARMAAEFAADRINAVVVLTDGRNEYPPDNDLPGLLGAIDASRAENVVRVFTIAYGEQADLGTLESIAKSSRAAAYDARAPASIDKVLVAVLSNF